MTEVDTVRPSSESPARLRALLVVLCVALALVVAGNSALAIALPDIAVDLGADQGDLTWIIDAYALTFAALLLPAGIAADRTGRRTLLLGGLVVFAGAGIASAFAPDTMWLIALRALAGVGAAAVFPVTLSALVDAYPEDRRGFAVAVWSGVSAAGAVAGTIIAGLLLEFFWWGSIQIFFAISAIALVPAIAVLVAQRRDPSLSLDPLGAAWAVVGLSGVVYAVIEAPQRGWADPATLVAFGVGGLALVGFVVHELRTAAPALDVRLFRNRGLAAGSLLVSLQFFASLALFVLAPQYLQIVREYSPLQAATALLVIPVGVGAGTALAPSALHRFGARSPGTAGMLAMAAGFAILATALGIPDVPGELASLGLLAAGLVVFGFGFGLAITPGTVLIIEGLPAERRSVSSAVNDITREVGGVLGIAVLSSVLISTYRSDIATTLASLPAQVASPAREGASTALGIASALGADGSTLADAARMAFAAGLSAALWLGAAVLAVTALVTWAVAPRGRIDGPRAGETS